MILLQNTMENLQDILQILISIQLGNITLRLGDLTIVDAGSLLNNMIIQLRCQIGQNGVLTSLIQRQNRPPSLVITQVKHLGELLLNLRISDILVQIRNRIHILQRIILEIEIFHIGTESFPIYHMTSTIFLKNRHWLHLLYRATLVIRLTTFL